MRKLTDKVKYTIHEDGHAEIHAKLKLTGKLGHVLNCHLSTVTLIEQGRMTLKEACDFGLMKPAYRS